MKTIVLHLKSKFSERPDSDAPLRHIRTITVPDGVSEEEVWGVACDAVIDAVAEKWPQPDPSRN